MSDKDALVVRDDNLTEEEKNVLLERLLSNNSDAVVWSYDISSHTMTIDFYNSSNQFEDRAIFQNYHKNIKDLSLISSEDEASFDVFCAEMDAAKDTVSAEYRAIGNNYELILFKNVGQLMRDTKGNPVGYRGRRYNITRERDSELFSENSQDILTGLYHRERVKELVNKQLNQLEGASCSFILIDIDNFSIINEELGQMQGDNILQRISGLIYTNFWAKDIIGRIQGDQFIVFCSDLNRAKVVELVNNLRDRIRENINKIGNHKLTISAGISFGPEDGNNFDMLYTKADIALAEAKNRGKNQAVIYSGESMCDICMGYTRLKIGRFEKDNKRVMEDSKNVNKKLFDFAFNTMTKEKDIRLAVEKVFAEVCRYYGLDRAVLHELDVRRQRIGVTGKWCRIDDSGYFFPAITRTTMWYQIDDALKSSENRRLFLRNGVGEGLDMFRSTLGLKYAPCDLVMLPVYDDDLLVALVAFDCFEEHNFTDEEIATLTSIIRLIRTYILSRKIKKELELESVISRNVMDLQQLVYFIIDGVGHRVKYLSPYARQMFPEAGYGINSLDVIWGVDVSADIDALVKGIHTQKLVQIYDETNDSWYNLTASYMKDAEEKDDIIVCITNVTDFLTKVRSADNLTDAESYDAFVVEATKKAINSDIPYGLLSIGIRNFARINDKYGYVAGDEILRFFASMIKGRMYHDEMVSRIKGDDFVCLIHQNDEELISHRIDRCTVVLGEEFRNKYPGIDLQCFAGYYAIKPTDEHINKCVDKAMKARNAVMKTGIKNSFCAYTDDLVSEEEKEAEAIKIIKDALRDDRVTVFFQPKVDSKDESVIGAEALVRIMKEEGGLVSPGLFIPVAEKTGLITDIDDRVYEKTFEYMAKWAKEGKKVPLTSVNVSRLQILDDNLPEKIKGMADKYGVSPTDIELEITESVFFDDTERLISMIERFKEMGFVISMDDFGSGYSTLNFLKILPVDVIKVDGGFFMKNEMDKKSKAIISAIIQMAENLEFKTVSEGVETKEQVDFIREQGGQCIQGYYFYKPMPADEFVQLI